MYAKLTKELSSYYIEEDGKKVYFREILINKSQSMFLEGISLETELDKKPSKSYKYKEQVIGCINFIGELYNNELLTNRIIQSCFNSIFMRIPLKKPYIIEILCTLIKTVSETLLTKAPKEYDEYKTKLLLLKNNKLPNITINKKDMFSIMDICDQYLK